LKKNIKYLKIRFNNYIILEPIFTNLNLKKILFYKNIKYIIII
jgi:hypothetical protein